MNNIDNIIRSISENNIEIPVKIQNRINYTLKNKNKRKETHYFRNFITAMISIFSTIIGTFAVYAATGGTIDGIPATDWLGIKFSNKYIEYKQPVEDQIIAFENTSVELTSTLCNEGITILEFDIKLSEEDYKKLKIGESVITDEYLKLQEENKTKIKDDVIRELKNEIYNKEMQKGNYNIKYEDIVVPEEDINTKYKEELTKIEETIEERKNTFFRPALALNVEQKGGTYNYDVFNPDIDWYATIYIDDIPYYVTNMQKIEKINDFEYKVYTMYAITDNILKEKENFKITLKNNKLVNNVAWNNLADSWTGHCQWFARYDDSEYMKTPPITIIDLPGKFEVNVSKNNVLKDSIVIENPDIKSEFRNITQKVEKVVASPIQTIVKINHSSTQQSSNAFANRYDNPNIEHLPLTRKYKVYDANGNELSCFSMTNKNTLIYSDGTREDYDPHDIPNKKYSNATWENINYLLIENTNTDYIKIVPVEVIRNPVDGSNSYEVSGEIEYDMDPLIINLK